MSTYYIPNEQLGGGYYRFKKNYGVNEDVISWFRFRGDFLTDDNFVREKQDAFFPCMILILKCTWHYMACISSLTTRKVLNVNEMYTFTTKTCTAQ